MSFPWIKRCIDAGIFSAGQFLVFTTVAMFLYSGGTIHEPHLESYSFLYNFFSDLGRTQTFDRTPNYPTYYIYIATLTVAGLGVSLFNVGVPFLFHKPSAKSLAIVAGICGVAAGLSYVGTALHPWNVEYWTHTRYVRFGFIAFMLMSFCYAAAIYKEHSFPNHYAHILLVFALLLAIQIVIMIFGPRSYHSNEALFIQATAQKIVVYGEIISMLYFCIGARRLINSA